MAIFNHESVTVVYVLGGPGAGKGTQCSRLVDEFDFVHISVGKLLRDEQEKPSSKHGTTIRQRINQGAIVETRITIELLRDAMRAAFQEKTECSTWKDGKGRFLIDGFPRNIDQALEFDRTICKASFVLYLDCSEDILLERVLKRGKTSDREDDNEETLKKRLVVYNEETKPVIEYYAEQKKVARIDARLDANTVFENARKAIDLALEGANEYTL